MSSKPVIPLKPLDFDMTARAVEQFTQRHNVPTLNFPAGASVRPLQEPARVAVQPQPAQLPAKRRSMKRLPMEVPEYVIESLKRKALETKGASVRYIVLSALKAYGIEVGDEELVKDKRCGA